MGFPSQDDLYAESDDEEWRPLKKHKKSVEELELEDQIDSVSIEDDEEAEEEDEMEDAEHNKIDSADMEDLEKNYMSEGSEDSGESDSEDENDNLFLTQKVRNTTYGRFLQDFNKTTDWRAESKVVHGRICKRLTPFALKVLPSWVRRGDVVAFEDLEGKGTPLWRLIQYSWIQEHGKIHVGWRKTYKFGLLS